MKFVEFERFLNQALSKMPLEKCEAFLNKVANEWIPKILEKKTKNYTLCPECEKYSLTKDFTTYTKKEISDQSLYRDAGYGDDDTHGDVEYIVSIRKCPICGAERIMKKNYIRTLNEYDKYGNRIR